MRETQSHPSNHPSRHHQQETVASACPLDFKDVPLTKANWKTEYEGFGQVVFQEDENLIFMAPKEARVPSSTHASLVLSKFDILSENFDLIVDYKNEAALRKENPNPWEVFWLFFNYIPGSEGTKTTNYAVAKPNGFEVGRAAQLVDQYFVKTTEHVKATFNEWHSLRVQVQNGAAKFYFDENYVFDAPASVLFTASGKIGLYTEDASVVIKRVCLNSAVQLRY